MSAATIERTCSLDGCTRKHRSRRYCHAHYERFRLTGDPGPAEIAPATVDEPTYEGAHRRVHSARGSAGEHRCRDCGAPAAEWAYDHTDPDELFDARHGSPYSLDLERYVPLCRPCHRRFDSGKIDQARCVELYAQGISSGAIAEMISASSSGVRRALARAGVQLRPTGADATHCPHRHQLAAPNLVASALTWRRPQRKCLACSRAIADAKNARTRRGEIWTTEMRRATADAHYARIMGGGAR